MAKPSFSRDQIGLAALVSHASINPVDGSQTANHANSTSPALAELSNTTPSYLTLGGRYRYAAVAGAATDYALFAFQVPAGFRLLVTSISISATVTGAPIVAATVLDWSLGVKSPAPSLATPGLIRIPLGTQGFSELVGIGEAAVPSLARDFDPELVAEHGEFVHVILQQPTGAATPNLAIRGDVLIHGYFEDIVG